MKPLVILMLILTCNTLFSKELERVSLQLQWLHQFQFAGFYVAKERGFYEDVGLDLDIIEYNHDINIVDDIHSGKTNYATGRSSLLIHRAHHDDIVLLDAIFEHSPSILISTNPSIKKPSDLKDKQIMITDDQATASSFYAMFLSQGVNPKSIRKQRHSFNLDDLIQGRTDAMACYISNEPYLLDQKGISYSIMNPKDYGYDFYGDLLYSSEQELYAHPKRTEAFVKASRKGWFEAFNNIETTAKLIHEHYNTQNKSLEALIYEGKILKTLWCDNPKKGTVLSFERFQTMAEFYRLNNFLNTYPDLKKFIDPIHFNRSQIKIGILSKRGVTYTIKRWKPTIEHLNFMLPQYHIEIIPLGFEAVNDAIANKSIDFILTNSMQYVQLEAEHGTSRLATLINPSPAGGLSQFGSVIFTHAKNREIHTLDDLKNRRFAAVNPYSFGGWIMALKTLIDNAITQEDFSSLAFLHTHDKVVEAVLKRDVDAGTVRTNILEHMAQEGKIDLKDFKILHPQHYDDFPYLLSTELYPEWSFAKLAPTSQVSANALLSELLKLNQEHDKSLTKWSIPINYKPVHDLLKTLEMTPYLRSDITFKQLLEQYRPWLIIALVV
ncbi:MAG: ABC transporter substrate-binding protein, partial [Campylobacterota bacterium]|nr:ABC transporter substrate-binding protein [Campylobacterota bacterium]